MKKLMSVVFAMMLIALVTSCGHQHTWIDATCTMPKTCSECGETEGEALGHKWVDATCTTARTCSVCGETEGEALGHVWADATCTKPKTCNVCGTTEGQPLGHKWVDATCTTPKTCSVCGETEGEPLGHQVEGVSCTEGGVCSRCGEEIPPAGHTWVDATCTEPKTCSVCGETEGEALGHTTQSGKCDRCGLEIYEPYTGKGDDVLTDVNVGDGIYRAHITNSGSRNFIVKVYDSTNDKDLLVNTIGGYDGYVLLQGTPPYSFEINSSGSWSIQMEKLTTTSESSFSGTGDYVTGVFSSTAKKWHIVHDGSHNFIVKGYSTSGRELLVNTIGSYDGNVLFQVPSGSAAFFEITAGGKWTIEPAN